MSWSMKLEGTEELKKAFGNYPNIYKKVMGGSGGVMDKVEKIVRREAKSIVPRGAGKKTFRQGGTSGRLGSGIKGFSNEKEAILENKVKYAVFVHEGTSKWPLSKPARNGKERQFFTKALENKKSDVEKEFSKGLEEITRELSR